MEELTVDFSDFKNWEFVHKRLAVEKSPEIHYRLNPEATSSTSFLIPNDLIDKLIISKNRYFTLSGHIRNLLEESAYLIYQALIVKKREKLTRTYQKEGLDLKKVSCRIADKELIEMDIMSHGLGISRSRLLAIMLELAELGWLKAVRELGLVRGTTFLRSIQSHQYLDALSQTYKIEIFHLADSHSNVPERWR
ncbi:DUF1564 family protein [Leptospira ilyithenensis]|uniref:DUF1564 family protein n=1 Tax=Leptospira ilyithenensis TaxID=2484901 RepID=A0A4R9LIM4_9LEPT|nr:DUF1564 family protein [Leptospira ilyithenensis]TGN06495.1 DUF1564 family protein [Leptospira ilyithenensis]